MTKETIIKRQIKDYLRLKGWFVFHNLAGLGVYPGISDFTAIRNGVVVFIEIKITHGKLSDNQRKFWRDIEANGGCYTILTSVENAIEFNKDWEKCF